MRDPEATAANLAVHVRGAGQRGADVAEWRFTRPEPDPPKPAPQAEPTRDHDKPLETEGG